MAAITPPDGESSPLDPDPELSDLPLSPLSPNHLYLYLHVLLCPRYVSKNKFIPFKSSLNYLVFASNSEKPFVIVSDDCDPLKAERFFLAIKSKLISFVRQLKFSWFFKNLETLKDWPWSESLNPIVVSLIILASYIVISYVLGRITRLKIACLEWLSPHRNHGRLAKLYETTYWNVISLIEKMFSVLDSTRILDCRMLLISRWLETTCLKKLCLYSLSTLPMDVNKNMLGHCLSWSNSDFNLLGLEQNYHLWLICRFGLDRMIRVQIVNIRLVPIPSPNASGLVLAFEGEEIYTCDEVYVSLNGSTLVSAAFFKIVKLGLRAIAFADVNPLVLSFFIIGVLPLLRFKIIETLGHLFGFVFLFVRTLSILCLCFNAFHACLNECRGCFSLMVLYLE